MSRYSAFARALGIALFVIWAVLAVAPSYRSDWLLENLLVFVTVPALVWSGPRLGFGNATWACLFVFFVLHLVGAHYTYAEMPLFAQADGRNHYDRVVHFAYGLLMARPTLDLFAARVRTQGVWHWLLPVFFLSAHGAVYEVVEWWAAVLFGGDLGVAFLGTQGDDWDAQWDMALLSLGAVLGVTGWRLRERRAG